MTSILNLYRYAKTGVASKDMTAHEKLLALQLAGSGFPVITLYGISPFVFLGDGSRLTSWSIIGNLEQSGTPVQGSPAFPQECGDETQNLYDKTITDGVTNGYYINKNTQQEQALSTYEISYQISVTAGQTYKWTFNNSDGQTHSAPTVGYYDSTDTMIGVANHANSVTEFEFTVPAGCTYIRASVYKSKKDQAMLTLATAEQGAYIPITFNSVTQRVRLDEPIRKIGNHVDVLSSDGTETGTATREIKKLVFDGKESWTSASGVWYLSSVDDYLKTAEVTAVCSHYPVQANAAGTGDVENGKMCFGTSKTLMRLFIKDTNYSTTADWKAYLAAQFAAGTPVTVWYVLATPTVEQVTVPVLTTVTGENTLEIGTELPPSGISITGHIQSIGYILTDTDDYIIKDVRDYIITVEE